MERFQGAWRMELCDSTLETFGATQQEPAKCQTGGTGWRSLPVWRSHWKPVLQRREKSGCGFGLPC